MDARRLRLRRIVRSCGGAGSLEWVGMVAAAAIMVLALVVAAPGWGAGLSGKVSSVVCAVTGGSGEACDEADAATAGASDENGPVELERPGGASTFAADSSGGSGSAGQQPAVEADDSAFCQKVKGGARVKDGRKVKGGQKVCWAATGTRVEVCDETGWCTQQGIPSDKGGIACADDLQTADPDYVLCQVNADKGDGSIIARCRPTTTNPKTELPWDVQDCVNMQPNPPPLPPQSGCFGGYIDQDGARVELCEDPAGAIQICTTPKVVTARSPRACSRDLPDGVDDKFNGPGGLSCQKGTSAQGEPNNTVSCVLNNVTFKCTTYDGGKTQHHCQNLRKPPAPAPEIIVDDGANPTATPTCQPDLDPTCAGSVRGGDLPGSVEEVPPLSCDAPPPRSGRGLKASFALTQSSRFQAVCDLPAPRPLPGRPLARPRGVQTNADGWLSGTELVTSAKTTGKLKAALLHEKAVLETMRCGFGIDGIDGAGAAPKLVISRALLRQQVNKPSVRAIAITGSDLIVVDSERDDAVGGLAHETTHLLSMRTPQPKGGFAIERRHLEEIIARVGERLVRELMLPSTPGYRELVGWTDLGGAVPEKYAELIAKGQHFVYTPTDPVNSQEAASANLLIAFSLTRELAPLLGKRATTLPSGCEGQLASTGTTLAIARWFGDAVSLLKRSTNEARTPATLCDAMATTGASRGVARAAVASVFDNYEIGCDDRSGSGRDPDEL